LNTKNNKGKFLVFEGIDGSGISTQTERLKKCLYKEYGIKAMLAKEPSEGPIGTMIRQVLSGRMNDISSSSLALLFAADRLDHNENKIIPVLNRGDFVICDRYLWSSLAYQGIHDNMSWIREINKNALRPDLTIFIRVRPETSLERIFSSRFKTEIFEKNDILQKVLDNYIKLYQEWKDSGEKVVEIDGEQKPEQVEREIKSVVEKYFIN